jgi:hypothetical protein
MSAPYCQNLDRGLVLRDSIVQKVASTSQEDSPNTWEIYIVALAANFRMTADQGECPAHFVAEQTRSGRSIPAPPMVLAANHIGGQGCRPHGKLRFQPGSSSSRSS